LGKSNHCWKEGKDGIRLPNVAKEGLLFCKPSAEADAASKPPGASLPSPPALSSPSADRQAYGSCLVDLDEARKEYKECAAKCASPSPPPPSAQTKEELQDAVDAWCSAPHTALSKFGDISEWDVSGINDMSQLFKGKDTCNPDLSKWDTGKVTNMLGMFYGATSFNRDLSKWNTGKVTYMQNMFDRATSFNGDLSEWDTGKVTYMQYMFEKATVFNGDLSKWETGEVTNMPGMFAYATSFNGDLSKWDTGAVTNMGYMFYGATSFTNLNYCPRAPKGVVNLVCPP
jgi:surface protein